MAGIFAKCATFVYLKGGEGEVNTMAEENYTVIMHIASARGKMCMLNFPF